VDLALVGMQQDRAAATAGVIHRMIACPKHGWGVQDDTNCRRGSYFKGDTSGQDALPLQQAGALPNSQPPAPGSGSQSVMKIRVSSYPAVSQYGT
jgi:hypothetical protein